MRGMLWGVGLMLVGCGMTGDEGGAPDSDGSTTQSGATETTAVGSSSSSGALPQTGSTTTNPTGPVAEESSSSGSPVPDGPPCSVEVTSHGVLFDPLPRGDMPGVFPPSIADALENSCGCHTLESNAQNLEHTGLLAPGGTLFLEYADMHRPAGDGTFGQRLQDAIDDGGMPPGSCSFPEEREALLNQWFSEGMPDGSVFVPPA